MAKITFTTPKGVASYPYITRADFEFNPEGVYRTKLKVSADEAAPLMKAIEQAAADEFGTKAKTARMPFKKLDDTGEIEFTTKSKFKPSVADSAGKVIPENAVPAIYGGSKIKAAGTIYPYNQNGQVGISLQLGGVQIIELAQSQAAASVSFAPEEGGYVAADNDNTEQSGDGASYNF